MWLPSRDQSDGLAVLNFATGSSLSPPLDGLRYSQLSPERSERNKRWRPSADQTAPMSLAASSVNRVFVVRSKSVSQMSAVFMAGSTRLTATWRLSGDSLKVTMCPGGTGALVSLPFRSNHES